MDVETSARMVALKAEFAKVQDDLGNALGMQVQYNHLVESLLLQREKLRAEAKKLRHADA